MNEEQLAAVTALIAGMSAAVVHLANVVAAKTGVELEELASSFEDTANRIPETVKNRELMQKSVIHIAQGIRSSAAGPAWDDLMSRIKH